jgi:hypothetical protein
MSLSSYVKYFSLTFFNSRCSYNSKIPVCDQIRAGCTICNLICSFRGCLFLCLKLLLSAFGLKKH